MREWITIKNDYGYEAVVDKQKISAITKDRGNEYNDICLGIHFDGGTKLSFDFMNENMLNKVFGKINESVTGESKGMTNFKKINSMTVEEMAKFIEKIVYDDIKMWHGSCDCCDSGKETRWCWECIKTWLESEVSENDKS